MIGITAVPVPGEPQQQQRRDAPDPDLPEVRYRQGEAHVGKQRGPNTAIQFQRARQQDAKCGQGDERDGDAEPSRDTAIHRRIGAR